MVSTNISLGGSLLLSRDGSPGSPLGLFKVVRAWCHLAKPEVWAPHSAPAGVGGVGRLSCSELVIV